MRPFALVAIPEGAEGGSRSTLSTSADPRVPPGSWKSSTTTKSGETGQVFRPGLKRDAGDGDLKNTYLELRTPQPPQPERGAAPAPCRRAPGAGKALPKLPTPGGGTAAANEEGAEPRPRSWPGWRRPRLVPPPLAPRLPAATGSPACPPPGPGITWPGPPAAAPDTGSRRKPETSTAPSPPAPSCCGAAAGSPRLPSPGTQRRGEQRPARCCLARGGRGCALAAAPAPSGLPPAWPWRHLS